MSLNKQKTSFSCVGLDISKSSLDASLPDNSDASFPYNETGARQFIDQCKQLHEPFVVCESTGGYEQRIVRMLLQEGIRVSVVMPGKVRAFAKAHGVLAKTDKIDARLLRRFAQDVDCISACVLESDLTRLRELIDLRRQLLNDITATKSQQENAPALTLAALNEQLALFKKQLEAAERLIEETVKGNETMRKKLDRMKEVKGVGDVLSTTILAHVPELEKLTARQLSSLVGVAPHPQDSGKRTGMRRISGGRKNVRDVLYMASVACVAHNPHLREFYQRLQTKGKPKKLCLTAVMRKLLCLIHKLLTNPQFSLA